MALGEFFVGMDVMVLFGSENPLEPRLARFFHPLRMMPAPTWLDRMRLPREGERMRRDRRRHRHRAQPDRPAQRAGRVPARCHGELEVTVGQYVAFLNTVDPEGRNERALYHDYTSPQAWPKYGSIAYADDADAGKHFSVAYPEWENKPFGFANFLRAARFVNSLFNGDVVSKTESTDDGFTITTYTVRLSRESEKGMYDMTNPATDRTAEAGFVVPSNNEWVKAAYYDPKGGGTHSYWLYPTGPKAEPTPSQLDPKTGDVSNASTQPLATYSPQGPNAPEGTYPTWCPSQVSEKSCQSVNPGNLPPGIVSQAFQGNLSTVGQTKTRSPWGTLDQGGNVVEWQDTIVPSFQGHHFKRTWRRMHGGVANAPSYQMLINAFGFQPQDQALLDSAYPWFGIRVGIVGELNADR